jgi:hypothetical protein
MRNTATQKKEEAAQKSNRAIAEAAIADWNDGSELLSVYGKFVTVGRTEEKRDGTREFFTADIYEVADKRRHTAYIGRHVASIERKDMDAGHFQLLAAFAAQAIK